MIEQILNFEAAYRRVLSNLVKTGFELIKVKSVNNNRYLIAIGKQGSILIAYKREPFYNFGKMFRDQGYKGVGDTINEEDIKIALRYGVSRIYTIFPNGRVYSIPIDLFVKDSIRWINKEGKQVLSISIHKYHLEFVL